MNEKTTGRQMSDGYREYETQNPLIIYRQGEILPIQHFYSHRHEFVMWLHLNQHHSYALHFWDLFLCIALYFGKDCLSRLQGNPTPWEDGLLETTLENCMLELKLEEPCTLVFENPHLLKTGPATTFLDWLPKHPVQDLSLAFLTDKEAALYRQGEQAHHSLADSEYRLTKEEIRIYLLAHGKFFREDTLNFLCHACSHRFTVLQKLLEHLRYNENLTIANIHSASEHIKSWNRLKNAQ